MGYMLTMTIMGFWHGLYSNYILYGIYHGILICATDFIFRKTKIDRKINKSILLKLISIFITFNLITFGFLIFSGHLFSAKITIFLGGN